LTQPPKVDAIFALHGRPEVGVGTIELDPLPNAACDAFDVRILGEGCHAAYPHRGRDPVVIGSAIVLALQQIVSRELSPTDEAVVSVGSFHAGDRRNVIPGEANLKGTIRTRSPDVRSRVVGAVKRISEKVAEGFGAKAEVILGESTPRVRNNESLLDLVREVSVDLFGLANTNVIAERSMGGEDFSFYLEEQGGVPGCIFRLGLGGEHPLHHERFDFNDAAIEPGCLLLANVALRFLGQGGVE
jgi:hippurate hydrolase